jgi:hypothetical protein
VVLLVRGEVRVESVYHLERRKRKREREMDGLSSEVGGGMVVVGEGTSFSLIKAGIRRRKSLLFPYICEDEHEEKGREREKDLLCFHY